MMAARRLVSSRKPAVGGWAADSLLTRVSVLVLYIGVGCSATKNMMYTRRILAFDDIGVSQASSETLNVTNGYRVVGRAHITPSGASFDHPGVAVLARFTGTTLLTATMSRVGDISNAFVVYCDGQRMAGGRYGGSTFNTSAWPQDGTPVSGIPLCGALDPEESHEVQVNDC